jgi:UDP-N-acetylglucosamine--dolichyl-phosphate N-acetylglucosaminephosphotransferase
MIPKVKEMTLKRGIKGKDINKKGTKEGEVDIPEALGIVPATIFSVFCMSGIAFLR